MPRTRVASSQTLLIDLVLLVHDHATRAIVAAHCIRVRDDRHSGPRQLLSLLAVPQGPRHGSRDDLVRAPAGAALRSRRDVDSSTTNVLRLCCAGTRATTAKSSASRARPTRTSRSGMVIDPSNRSRSTACSPVHVDYRRAA